MEKKNKIVKILILLILVATVSLVFVYLSNNNNNTEEAKKDNESSFESKLRGPVLSTERIEDVVRNTIEENKEELDRIDSMKMKENHLFGLIMRQLKGRADHRHVREILIEVLEEIYTD